MVVYIGKTFAGQIYQFSQVVLAESLKMLIGVLFTIWFSFDLVHNFKTAVKL